MKDELALAIYLQTMLQIDSYVFIVAGTENEAISKIKLGFGQ